MAGWLERTAQNVLQLERSREGVVWSRSAGADDKPFAECSALMQQRHYMVSALQAAKEEVKTAQLQLQRVKCGVLALLEQCFSMGMAGQRSAINM